MNNETLIRRLIQGSIQRAILESIAGLVVVVVVFGTISSGAAVASASYYGYVVIGISSVLIIGVVWSHALSDRLLVSHPPSDVPFWRDAFHAQARLHRLVPIWYCAPLSIGGIWLVGPMTVEEVPSFLIVAAIVFGVFATVIWVNRRTAVCIDDAARLLTE